MASSDHKIDNCKNEIQNIIDRLQLVMHPSCIGWFREMYRSEIRVTRLFDGAERSAVTGIYFLQTNTANTPKWRKIKSDETFVYLQGSPLKFYSVDTDAKNIETFVLGNHISDSNADGFFTVAKPGVPFNTEVLDSNSYTLMAIFVAPGFDFSDYEELSIEKLAEGMSEDQSKTIKKFK